MSKIPETTGLGFRDQDNVSSERRRLLKCAAKAAPLIATLPSGAALATASTSQCLVDNLAATLELPALSPDTYLSTGGCKGTVFQNPDGEVVSGEYYKIGSCPGAGATVSGSEWYDTSGNPLGQGEFVVVASETTQVIAIYNVDDTDPPTDLLAHPDPVSMESFSFYPKARPGGANTVSTATCLCSVSPDLDPGCHV